MDLDKFKKILQSMKSSKSPPPVDNVMPSSQTPGGEAQEEKEMLSLVKELDIPPIRLSKYLLDIRLLESIPEETARTYRLIPLARLDQGVTIAVVDPFNIVAIDMAKSLLQAEIYVVIATASDIDRAINKYYTMLSLESQTVASEDETALKEGYIKLSVPFVVIDCERN